MSVRTKYHFQLYARDKVKIRLLRGRSDFDVIKCVKIRKHMKNKQSDTAKTDFDVAKNGRPLRGASGGPSGARRAPPGPLRGPLRGPGLLGGMLPPGIRY
jgi:hypothetical protein